MANNGFAAAAQPITSDTIYTTADGIVAGDVSIDADGFDLPAYRAMPEGEGEFPIVVIVMEVFGLHEYIKDICRRFAHKGYIGIAPDIFARKGDPSGMPDFAEIRKIVNAVPDEQIMSDIDSAVDWAINYSNGNPDRIGITGFCWGGRITWLYAAHSSNVTAAVAWYGRLDGDHTEEQKQWPIDIAAHINCPVLGLYGGEDPSIPLEMVEKMREELKKSQMLSEIVIYQHAPHAFHADYRPSYRPEDAQDGEKRMYEWFLNNGVV